MGPVGDFRDPAYWISLAICLAFMIPVDGWLTKHSAPIVLYRPEDTSGIYPIGTSHRRNTRTPSPC